MNDFQGNNLLSFSQILRNLDIFENSFKSLQYDPQAPRSAVAIIVKKAEKQTQQKNTKKQDYGHDQILFMQRKKSPKDKFSGEICFPGGKQQKNQNLLTAVIRQTFQQTNIRLQQKYLIGSLDRKINLILSTKKDKKTLHNNKVSNDIVPKQMVVYAFVFIIPSQVMDCQKMKLNQEQMQSYKWVKTSHLMNKENICWFDYSQRIQGVLRHQNIRLQQNKQKVSEIFQPFSYINRVLSPAIDIGMNEKLYGVTLYITLIILVGLLKRFQTILLLQSQENRKYLKLLINSLKEIRQRCQTHVVFEIKQPIDRNFVNFQKDLLSGIYSLRPKL